MNKLVKSVSLVAIVFLYVFAVSVESFVVVNPAYLSNPDQNTTGYFTNQNAHLFSHTNQSLEVVFNFVDSNFPDPRDFQKFLLAANQVTNQLLESKYCQHIIAGTNFPVAFSKPDIVFPFHYFL